jgi:succinate-semialdehyde dehydrogenase/glutarate-semialdehyde dehydrogenase
VDELVAMLRGAAEDGIRIEGSIPASSGEGKRVLLMRRPKGPVAVITPWNWPYTMPAEIVAPALACGNTVVWNPAPSTAVCSGALAECIAEADLPPGVFNFVPGPGPVAGDEIVSNPGTVAVGFIGSPPPAGGSPSARRASRSCSRWAATARSSSWTTPTSRRPPRRRSPPASCAPARAAPPASGCSSTRR